MTEMEITKGRKEQMAFYRCPYKGERRWRDKRTREDSEARSENVHCNASDCTKTATAESWKTASARCRGNRQFWDQARTLCRLIMY